MTLKSWWRRGLSGDPGANFALLVATSTIVALILLITAALSLWALVVNSDRAVETSQTNQELIRLVCDSFDDHGIATQAGLNKLLREHQLRNNQRAHAHLTECERKLNTVERQQVGEPFDPVPLLLGMLVVATVVTVFILWRRRR